MHPVLEQIKQFLAPRWYKLQKSVVEFVKQFLVPKLRELQKYMVKFAKQFLVPKWHELQKYMLDFKERMTMKRMVVMCLLLVAVVCGILALVRGDGKQDWEKEPYPFEVKKDDPWYMYRVNSPVKVSGNNVTPFDMEYMVMEYNTYYYYLSFGFIVPSTALLFDENEDVDWGYEEVVLIEFSNGQKFFFDDLWDSTDCEFADDDDVAFIVNLDILCCDCYSGISDNDLIVEWSPEQRSAHLASMLRSYDIKTVAYCWIGENRFKEVLKFKFDKFNSAATVNAILNDIEKKLGSDEHFGKLLTKGSSSSNLSEKSISSDSDDDEEKIDSVLVEKSIVIKSVETQHNVVQNGQKGMNIIVNYSVEGMKGKTGDLNAYFYFEDGTPLKDDNKSSVPCYGTYDGSVVVGKQFTPRYDDVAMSSTLFMPYDELHLRKGKFSLKYYCAIFDDEMKQQATSNWKYFTVTQQ